MNLTAKQRASVITNMSPGDSVVMRAIQNRVVLEWSGSLDGLRVYNALNRKGHWSKRSKEAAEAKARAFNALVRQQVPMLPVTVTMVREGPHKLDDDGLAASLKHVRDGIAAAYGVDDGDERWKWVPAQERAKTWGVRIIITADRRQS